MYKASKTAAISSFLILAATLAYLPIRAFQFSPLDFGIDSAYFRVIGNAWLMGLVPYLEAYDLKGPLIFLLNAIGLYFFNDFNGPRLLGLIFACLTVLTTFLGIRHVLKSSLYASLGVFIVALLTAHTSEIFNATGVYTSFFSSVALYILIRNNFALDKLRPLACTTVGILCGCCILVVAKNFDLFLGLAFFWLYFFITSKDKRVTIFTNGLFILLGIAIACLPFFIYFYANNALMDFLDGWIIYGYTIYNEVHTKSDDFLFLLERLNLATPALLPIIAMVFITLKYQKIAEKKNPEELFIAYFISCCVIALVTLLAFKGGNLFIHYFAHTYIYYSFFIAILVKQIFTANNKAISVALTTAILMLLVTLGNTGFIKYNNIKSAYSNIFQEKEINRENIHKMTSKVVGYVNANTTKDDYIFFSGLVGNISVYTLSFTKSLHASRHFSMNTHYMSQIASDHPHFQKLINETIEDVYCHPPKLILHEAGLAKSVKDTYKYRLKLVKGLFIDKYYTKVKTIKNDTKDKLKSRRNRYKSFRAYTIYKINNGAHEKMLAQCKSPQHEFIR